MILQKGGRIVERKVKTVLAVILIAAFSILLPYSLQFENADYSVKETRHGAMAQPDYTTDAGNQILGGDYIRPENRAEAVFSQQWKNIQKISVTLFMLAAFSLCVCQKRMFLSCIQFYIFPLARFLCELCIRLKKDGKKRVFAF